MGEIDENSTLWTRSPAKNSYKNLRYWPSHLCFDCRRPFQIVIIAWLWMALHSFSELCEKKLSAKTIVKY